MKATDPYDIITDEKTRETLKYYEAFDIQDEFCVLDLETTSLEDGSDVTQVCIHEFKESKFSCVFNKYSNTEPINTMQVE